MNRQDLPQGIRGKIRHISLDPKSKLSLTRIKKDCDDAKGVDSYVGYWNYKSVVEVGKMPDKLFWVETYEDVTDTLLDKEYPEDEIAREGADSIEDFKQKVASYDIMNDFKKEDIETLAHCVEMSAPALLIGQTGLGKTTLISELAKKHNRNLIRLSVHSGITGDEILGKWLAKNGSTVWQYGLLIQAMQNGDWIVFDEINACPADVLFALHSLLDDDRKVTLVEKDGEIIRPHADFRFFATMNPIDDYAGTKELNMAFFSRFGAVIEIQPFPSDVEERILVRKGIANVHAQALVTFGNTLRNLKAKDDIVFFCGTRDLIHAGHLLQKGMKWEVAVNYGILNKMSKDDRELVYKTDPKTIIKDAKDKEIEKLKEEVKALHKANTQKDSEFRKKVDENTQLQKEIVNLKQNAGANLDPKTKNALKILGVLN